MPSNPSSLLKVSTVPVTQSLRAPGPLARPDSRALFESVRGAKDGPRMDFDPMIVAKRGDGWEAMLEVLIVRWVESVAKDMEVTSECNKAT
jgi:hypothetical protein